MKTRQLTAIAAAVAIALSSPAALAATYTINATVVNACTSLSDETINFGTITWENEPTYSPNIGFSCTAGTTYEIAMDDGLNYSDGTRHMSDGSGNLLAYNILKDVQNSLPFGEGPNALVGTASGVGGFPTDNYSMFIQIPLGQIAAPAGNYSDSVTVTLSIVS